jgi:hypothetical protein
VTENSTVFWDVTPCTILDMSGDRALVPGRSKHLVIFDGAESAVGPFQSIPRGFAFGI